MINKPYSEACEQNKEPILSVIKQWFTEENSTVLEIGSGTGQHAAYFPAFLPNVHWQPSDVSTNIDTIEAWRLDANLANVYTAKTLDVAQSTWPIQSADYIFSANSVHIMSWAHVESMFAGIRKILKPNGIFCLYGPFNYKGEYTSPSNAQFEQWLKSRDINSGIRDFEALCDLATSSSIQGSPLTLVSDHQMPANNQILVFKSQA